MEKSISTSSPLGKLSKQVPLLSAADLRSFLGVRVFGGPLGKCSRRERRVQKVPTAR